MQKLNNIFFSNLCVMSFFQDEHYKIQSAYSQETKILSDGAVFFLFNRSYYRFSRKTTQKTTQKTIVYNTLKSISNYQVLPIDSLFNVYFTAPYSDLRARLRCLVCGQILNPNGISMMNIGDEMWEHIDRKHFLDIYERRKDFVRISSLLIDIVSRDIKTDHINFDYEIDCIDVRDKIFKLDSHLCYLCDLQYGVTPTYEVIISHLKKCKIIKEIARKATNNAKIE